MRECDWAGHPCIIIGGGPSLQGLDWARIINRNPHWKVIVVNRAMVDVPNADVFFTEDTRFVEKYATEPSWAAFTGRKVVHALTDGFADRLAELDPSIEIVRRVREDKFWSRSFAEGLSFASNSGVGAINLADLLGCPSIHMLGFDCTAGPKYVENYHDDYPEFWKVGSTQAENYRSDFTHWVAPHVQHRQVVSVINPECPSALKCWPTMTQAEFLGVVK